jgi:hypothetical protein
MKLIKYILFFFIFLSGLSLLAQSNRYYETNPDRKRTNIWYFGQNAGVNFNTTPPTTLTDGKINTWESTGIICDTSGNLMFYTDGKTVWNKLHLVVKNGTNLLGDRSSSQTGLILKHPDNDSFLFIINTPYSYDYAIGMTYSILDVFSDSGRGEIIIKNKVLHPNSSEKVGATYHSNGKDIWIIGHEWGNNVFFKYLLTKEGIIKCGNTQLIGVKYIFHSPKNTDYLACQGFIKFSPNGSMMAHVLTAPDVTDKYNELYFFNNLNGNLILGSKLYYNTYAWGAEFSSNGKYLYINEENRPIQIFNTKTFTKLSFPSITLNWRANFQIASDLNIYIGEDDSFYISKLFPVNKNWDTVSFQRRTINLIPQRYKYGTPNFLSSYFYTPSIDFAYNYDCTTNSISFEGRDTFDADSFHWQIKKLYGSIEQTTFSKNPNIAFNDTGWYEIRFIATKGNRSDTVIKQIELFPKINKGFLGKDTTYQSNVPFSLQLLTPPNMHCIQWHDSSNSNTFTADTTGIYYVRVTNKAFCTVSDTIIVSRCLNSLTKPVLTRYQDTLKVYSPDADSFVWYKGNQPIANTKDTFILLTDTGTYKVIALKSGYCNHISELFYYPCMIGMSQPTVQLSNDTLSAYQIQADSFNWYKNNQFLINTKDSFIVLSDTGTYKVEALKSKFCSSFSEFIEFKCLNTLNDPTLFRSRDTLFTSNLQVDSFIWFRNGIRVHSGPDSFFKMNDTGWYRVEIYRRKYCNKSSGNLFIEKLNTGLDPKWVNHIKIYPNPANDRVNIETDIEESFSVKIFNLEGKLMFEKLTSQKNIHIDISQFTQGIYFIELNNKETFYHYKLLTH